ncbi:hypothetical protein Slin15195_G070070 [Septoria linicola]|uniref:Uncharacterized protein n=1 Tax=Septoria linicola TaxID=215465 RepID=A0A9Q9ELR0_9PEZI|nr:hypothetical protein Slin14017_G102820 [Septoria linicola]USW53688.1 hypothetical protein Slin15195_G070070 [Septoria linicola]
MDESETGRCEVDRKMLKELENRVTKLQADTENSINEGEVLRKNVAVLGTLVHEHTNAIEQLQERITGLEMARLWS